MKSVAEFLSYLYSLDVKIWIEGDRLRCKVPRDVATPALRAELAERKPEIMAFLSNVEAAERYAAPPIRPATQTKGLPLSFAQQRLWFIDQFEPGNPHYNILFARRLSGPFDVAAMGQSIDEIVRRHQVLRTNLATVAGRPTQVVAPASTVPLPVVDLQHLPQAVREAEARRLATQEAQWSFDLERDPLLRATVLRMGPNEHVLLLNFHHIVFDGWSTGIFMRELSTLYRAFISGQPSPLPELPIQYADFAVWQREWLRGQVLENQLDYWKGQLSGAPGVLELPIDRPRPAVRSFSGSIESLTLSRDVATALQGLSQQQESTLFMTLLAAFNLLLYRYTGQPDILVGSPIANRNRSEIEGLIGFFVNTLVLRTDLSGDPTFRELLDRVRRTTLAAYAHQDLPFEKLVEELRPERDTSRSPLFQVMFILQNASGEASELAGLSQSPFGFTHRTSKFDLTLFVENSARGLGAAFEYNTDLFDAATIGRMLGHFQVLLEGILANPDQRLSDLPLLTAAEQQQMLVAWNDTGTGYPRDRCVHQWFEARVEQTPEAAALVSADESLTYHELNQRANQLARHLQTLGVGPEVPVAVCVERSPDLVVGILAVLKAGGAYMPIDPACPQKRLTFMLEDAQASVLVTRQRWLEGMSSLDQERVICLDTDWEIIAEQSGENLPCPTRAHNLAYVIYTSGSTGQPKGVQIEHGSLLNLVFWHQHTFEVSQADRATQIAGVGFDASVWELWPHLISGACVYLPDDETRALPLRLREWLLDQEISLGFLPTPLAESVLDLAWPRQASLRLLLTGGDQLHTYPSALLPYRLVNNYGPTENTVVTTSGVVLPTEQADVLPSIGRPIANVQVFILDAHGHPVPVGVPGELHVGGDGLARGYLNRPGLTADKFRPNPFSPRPGARLYRTGDLARYRPDGEIEFLGRIDHQVKIRGFRIELGEVEAVLGQHPAVRETVVLARDAEGEPGADVAFAGEKRLVAYVVPDQEPAPPTSQLRGYLKQKLPEYMIPAAFVMLAALPLTPSGKVDRRALPAPEGGRPELERAFLAPRTPTEERLAGIWARILDLERVGVHDNFFDLGGHSLLAIRVVSRVRDAFQIELSLLRLFEAPTIAELAQSIDGAFETQPAEVSKAIDLEDFVGGRL